MKIDKDFLMNYRSARGGWNYSQLASLGIEWPPAKGWMQRIFDGDFTKEQIENFVKFGQKKPSKAERREIRRVAKLNGQVPSLPPVRGATKTLFLSSYAWRKLRMVALKNFGAKCQCCGATPATGAVLNVDHIKPRNRFPELALRLDNLQILCHECNHGKGNWDTTDWRDRS